MNSSSYDNLDFLQKTVPFTTSFTASGLPPQPTDSKKTKFGSILNDLSSFLSTAADSAVTVDGIINGRNKSSGSGLTPQQQMALIQAQRTKSTSANMTTILIIGGIAVVGGTLMVTMLKKKNK